MTPQPLPSTRTRKLHSAAELIHEVKDDFGRLVAELAFFPVEQVLYVRWHGHLTAEEVILVAKASLPWHEQLHPVGLLNDKRGTSGDWGEAMSWVEFEWIPRAKASGLRAFAYVINPDMMISFENAALIQRIQENIPLRTYYGVGAAWRWLRQVSGRLPAVA